MKKIPTLFRRDDNGVITRALAIGVDVRELRATVKVDGACCMVRDGKLYKRRELKKQHETPVDFELIDTDPVTDKRVGWMPVTDAPEDKWFRAGFDDIKTTFASAGYTVPDGTYELLGPKINGNPTKQERHTLSKHGVNGCGIAPGLEGSWKFDELKDVLLQDWWPDEWEGIVWWDHEKPVCKIKVKDFKKWVQVHDQEKRTAD